MKQAVMTAPGRIEIQDIPKPEAGPNQVVVKVKNIGICGSDIHVYHGKHPYTSYPVVQGHEVSGEVEVVGSEVTGVQQGDRITIQPQIVCGKCYACRHGSYHICDNLKVMGFQTTGAASEYFTVDAEKLLKLPEQISLEHGAMVEPLAVAVHALGRYGQVAGKKILVLGAGPIGNLVAQAAKGMGADQVMIVDISDFRIRLAEKCGIDHTVNNNRADLGEELQNAFGKDRADLILECVGINTTIEQAIQHARKGTDIIVVGVFGDKATVDLGLVQDRELKLIGTLMYQEKDFCKAIELMAERKVVLEPLITDYFDFQNYQKAYEYIEEKKDKTMKVMIRL
ncbi:MAG TPA: alcohol dehydrogenase catalytic domain-containing protein [archaeon]|nr:alcohol dehydrogenase catalytic domain-containing protein [archaeon]